MLFLCYIHVIYSQLCMGTLHLKNKQTNSIHDWWVVTTQ